MHNNFETLNWLAIIVAAVSAFILGGFWYSPVLFGKRWMKETGITQEAAKKSNQYMIFSISFLLSLLAAIFLALFIGEGNALQGIHAGLFSGVGWVATFFGITYLFEFRSIGHFLINAGYSVLTLMLMGLIIGAWH